MVRQIRKVGDFFRSIKRFIRNIYVFRRTLVGHYPWDYGAYYLFIKDLTDDLRSVKSTTNEAAWDNRMVKAKIIGHLADRLYKEEYSLDKFSFDMEFVSSDERGWNTIKINTTPLNDFPVSTTHINKMKLEEQDFDMMQLLIKKHLRTFWD